MGRPLRMFAAGETYFITQRCCQGRFLFTPTPKVVETIGGLLAKATQEYPGIHLHDAVFLSNHYHLILTLEDPTKLPRFMGWLSREISVRVGRLVDWSNGFYSRRYDAAPILDDDALQRRLLYLRSHGVKEGLVAHPRKWPGLSLLRQLESGVRKMYPYRNDTDDRTEWHFIRVVPLPGWEDLSQKESRKRHRRLTEDACAYGIEHREGTEVLGAEAVVAQSPHTRPEELNHSPRVPCFASSQQAYLEYRERYSLFVEVIRYRYASVLTHWRALGEGYYCLPGFGFCT